MVELPPQGPWQVMDEELGVLFPWYTKSFLDELKTWDLYNKYVFEFGVGHSSVWYASRGARVFGVDDDIAWVDRIHEKLKYNRPRLTRHVSFAGDQQQYVQALKDLPIWFSIIVVDGARTAWRDDCIAAAVEYIAHNGILIVDNWLQQSVWVASQETQELLSKYECHIFKQDGHPDWKTAYWIIKK